MLGKLNLTFPIIVDQWRVGLEGQYLGSRLALLQEEMAGTVPDQKRLGAVALADLTLSSERKWYGLSAWFSIRQPVRPSLRGGFALRLATAAIPQDAFTWTAGPTGSSCATISERTDMRIFFLLFSIWLAGGVLADSSGDRASRIYEADMKAAYIYNFGAFMEWPESSVSASTFARWAMTRSGAPSNATRESCSVTAGLLSPV